MKKLLGSIIESYTMGDAVRVLILDGDCSADLSVGNSVEVEFPDGKTTVVKVQDTMLEDGSKFGVTTSEKIASIVVDNVGFPEQRPYGCKVFLA